MRMTKTQLLERIAEMEKELKQAKNCSSCCTKCPIKNPEKAG